jgi:hypothetical protein
MPKATNTSSTPPAHSEYAEQFEQAIIVLDERFKAAIEQLRSSLDDALASEWYAGIALTEWTELAALRAGI